MKTVLVCNQKGGVGKTTICDCLAYSFDRTETPYSLFDLDGQGTLLHTPQEMPDAEVTIIDTPGALQPQLHQWMQMADLIIVPTRANSREIGPLQTMIDITSKYKDKTMFVLNCTNRYMVAKSFSDWFLEEVKGQTVVRLPQSEDFVKAAMMNQSVVTFSPHSTASEAVRHLVDTVRRKLELPLEFNE